MRSEQFLRKLTEFIDDNHLIKKGDRLLIGYSGGADSTALTHLLWRLKNRYRISLLVAHVNYNLRGDDSVADRDFVVDFCSQYSLLCQVKEVKLEGNQNLENRARDIRYEYFRYLADLHKITKIAVGHNKEDSVETMLLHFFRGSGIFGLRGIQAKNGDVIRPLLCFSREEIIEYLKENKINNWREDKSNNELAFSRNKIRNELIPWVKEKINPNIINLLYENSLVYKQTDDYLEASLSRLSRKAVTHHSNKEIRVTISQLNLKNPIILYYLFRKIFAKLTHSESDFYRAHFNEVYSLMESSGSKMINLPCGILVQKEYDTLRFINTLFEESSVDLTFKDSVQTIDLSKKFHLFNEQRIIITRISIGEVRQKHYEDKDLALFDLDKLLLPLSVGYRENGDRFVPLGMSGHKKLKAFFIDEKISKFERDNIMVFRDSEKIIWIGGIRLDDRVKIDDTTQNVLSLKVEKVMQRTRRSAQRRKKQ